MMTNKTAVLVCGIGCSGTSLTASIVQACGVPLHLEGHSNTHPVTGHPLVEDQCFYGTKFEKAWNTHARKYVEHGYKMFGVKNTVISLRLYDIVLWLLTRGYKVKIIAAHRRIDKSVAGRIAGKCPPGVTHDRDKALSWAYKATHLYTKGLLECSHLTGVEILNIQFEELLKNRDTNTVKIYNFLWDVKKTEYSAIEDKLISELW